MEVRLSATLMPLTSRDVALELHHLLRDLDPARWRDDLHHAVHARVDALRQRLSDATAGERLDAVRQRLDEIARFIDQHAPRLDLPASEIRTSWTSFRTRMVPIYEHLAAGLRAHQVHVPSLRPTNYKRNLFHISWGAFVLIAIETFLTVPRQRWICGAFFVSAWFLEVAKRRWPWVNTVVMKGFGPFAHPHEWHRVNSATWYVTALLILAWLSPIPVSACAVVILALGDPAAAVIGRRWGRTKLVHGRSLEGTLTFAVVGTVAATAVLTILHGMATGPALAIAFGAATFGAIAELLSGRIDDNFTIPLAAAAGAATVISLLAG
jgi:dolichol kinase